MDLAKIRVWLWTAGIVAALILLAGTVWLGRSTYRQHEEARDQAQAQAFLAKGDYRNALLSARSTLLLDPTNVPASRVMAAIADLSHSPAALDMLRRIVQIAPTVENKLLLAAAGLRYQNPPFPLTTQILEELAATNLAGYQVVAASLALSTRRVAEAEEHFETAARLEPTNRLYELNLAVVRLGETNEAKAASARLVLQNLRTNADLGAAALRALVVDRLAHQELAAANDYSTQLLASPQASLADQLQQLGILQQLKSESFSARLQAVQQLAATNAPAVAAVASWMQANHLLDESVNWLTNLPVGIRNQPTVRLALADGYLQGKDWVKLRDFTAHGNWDELEFIRLALVSRVWSQLGQKEVADSNWNAAVNEAVNRFGALTALLNLAEQWQLPREQEDLLKRIVERFPREHWAQSALAQRYYAAGNTAALNQLYAKLCVIFPQNESFKNNLAATALLLKTNLTQAAQWAAEAYAQSPGNPDTASTYAFALHLQDRNQEGLAVLQKFKPAQLARPSVALYYGVLLAAAGNAEAASYLQIARTQGRLLPEEEQLLASALGEAVSP